MTPQQLVQALNNATDDEIKDFNDNSDHTVYFKGGSGETDGVDWAGEFANFNETQQAYVRENLDTFGIKTPC